MSLLKTFSASILAASLCTLPLIFGLMPTLTGDEAVLADRGGGRGHGDFGHRGGSGFHGGGHRGGGHRIHGGGQSLRGNQGYYAGRHSHHNWNRHGYGSWGKYGRGGYDRWNNYSRFNNYPYYRGYFYGASPYYYGTYLPFTYSIPSYGVSSNYCYFDDNGNYICINALGDSLIDNDVYIIP